MDADRSRLHRRPASPPHRHRRGRGRGPRGPRADARGRPAAVLGDRPATVRVARLAHRARERQRHAVRRRFAAGDGMPHRRRHPARLQRLGSRAATSAPSRWRPRTSPRIRRSRSTPSRRSPSTCRPSAGEWVPTGITCLPGAAYSVWGNGVITWGADQELTAVDADGTEVFDAAGQRPERQRAEPRGRGARLPDRRHRRPAALRGLGTDSYFDCYAGGGRIGQVVLGVNDLDTRRQHGPVHRHHVPHHPSVRLSAAAGVASHP